MSAGPDNVHLINPGEDWQAHFDKLLGHVNGFELRNDTVVVQEYLYLEDTEYIVDFYSVDGQHGLVNTCVYAMRHRHLRHCRFPGTRAPGHRHTIEKGSPSYQGDGTDLE